MAAGIAVPTDQKRRKRGLWFATYVVVITLNDFYMIPLVAMLSMPLGPDARARQ
jgi:hypothetical protein